MSKDAVLESNRSYTAELPWRRDRKPSIPGVDFPHRVTLPYKVCRDAARAEFTQTSRSQEKAWPPWVAFLVLRLLLSPFRPHFPFILHPFVKFHLLMLYF